MSLKGNYKKVLLISFSCGPNGREELGYEKKGENVH